jgi:hypothetical protein
MIDIVEPLYAETLASNLHLIEIFFRFIPPIFYVNVCLYFMVIENIIPAIAEATKIKHRVYYEDWWNA